MLPSVSEVVCADAFRVAQVARLHGVRVAGSCLVVSGGCCGVQRGAVGRVQGQRQGLPGSELPRGCPARGHLRGCVFQQHTRVAWRCRARGRLRARGFALVRICARVWCTRCQAAQLGFVAVACCVSVEHQTRRLADACSQGAHRALIGARRFDARAHLQPARPPAQEDAPSAPTQRRYSQESRTICNGTFPSILGTARRPYF